MRDTFIVGMRATSRSESMDAFFKMLYKFNLRIHELVMVYDHKHRKKNNKICSKNFNKFSQLTTSFLSLESRTLKVYTKTMLLQFVVELRKESGIFVVERI